MSDFSAYVVHDCAYCPAGKVEEMVMALKKSYIEVVAPDRLGALNESNGTDVLLPEMGEVNILSALRSDYMFS